MSCTSQISARLLLVSLYVKVSGDFCTALYIYIYKNRHICMRVYGCVCVCLAGSAISRQTGPLAAYGPFARPILGIFVVRTADPAGRFSSFLRQIFMAHGPFILENFSLPGPQWSPQMVPSGQEFQWKRTHVCKSAGERPGEKISKLWN